MSDTISDSLIDGDPDVAASEFRALRAHRIYLWNHIDDRRARQRRAGHDQRDDQAPAGDLILRAITMLAKTYNCEPSYRDKKPVLLQPEHIASGADYIPTADHDFNILDAITTLVAELDRRDRDRPRILLRAPKREEWPRQPHRENMTLTGVWHGALDAAERSALLNGVGQGPVIAALKEKCAARLHGRRVDRLYPMAFGPGDFTLCGDVLRLAERTRFTCGFEFDPVEHAP